MSLPLPQPTSFARCREHQRAAVPPPTLADARDTGTPRHLPARGTPRRTYPAHEAMIAIARLNTRPNFYSTPPSLATGGVGGIPQPSRARTKQPAQGIAPKASLLVVAPPPEDLTLVCRPIGVR